MDVAGYSKAYSLDQGDILGNDQIFQALYNLPLTDAKRQGICTGLSMIWLARRMMFHSENAEQRRAALYTGAAFRWGGRTQDIHLASGVGSGAVADMFQTMYGQALQAYALRIVRRSIVFEGHTDAGGDADAVLPTVAESGAYCLYNIGLATGSGDAGHMVASYASHGTLGLNKHFYLFDPNMGEYRVGLKDARDLLTKWVEAYEATFVGVNYISAFEVDR